MQVMYFDSTKRSDLQVIERANIHDVKGKVLVEFNENQGTFDFPRGRYSIEMYSHFMRMHGSRCAALIVYTGLSTLTARVLVSIIPDTSH